MNTISESAYFKMRDRIAVLEGAPKHAEAERDRLRAEVASLKECDRTRLETIRQLRDELDAALGRR